jgi:thiamine biosynthesis lipoprotein
MQQTRVLMGTLVNLTLIGDETRSTQAAIEATLDRMSGLEAILSHYRPDSQLSQLNREGHLDAAAPPLLDLLALARRISERSEGAFDVTVKPLVDLYQNHQAQKTTPPAADIQQTLERVDYRRVIVEGQRVAFARPGMAVTLDSIAKGYIVDEGIAVLRAHGYADVLVEAGGDLHAAGTRSSSDLWEIGILSPRKRASGILARLSISDAAVATSGDYQQPYTSDLSQHHILDPRTGYSAPELASATIIAPTAALADALATAAMVLGPRAGLELIGPWPECSAYLVSKDLETFRS